MVQLSTDHVISDHSPYAGYLTQCLGASDREQRPDPALFYSEYREGDLFLLCTDGLTKLVSDRRIEAILKKRKNLQDKAREMKDIVLRKGAVDNATILLFKIKKRKRRFSNIFAVSLL